MDATAIYGRQLKMIILIWPSDVAGQGNLLLWPAQGMLLAHCHRRWPREPAYRAMSAFMPVCMIAMPHLVSMYGLWNLWAGYNGFFTPYLIEQNHLPEWTSTVVPAGYFAIGMISILFIFMRLSDKINQRTMFGISALMHIFGMALLAIFGFKPEIVIGYLGAPRNEGKSLEQIEAQRG